MRQIKAVKLTSLRKPTVDEEAKQKELISTLYCPRCQRPYDKGKGELYQDLLDRVKYHVSRQHPDHDPEWWDTYPDPEPDTTVRRKRTRYDDL